MILLLRHARALDRESWTGDDALRPLSGRGERQAVALAGTLGATGTTALVSSPALRCVSTLTPLAERLGVTLEISAALAEGEPGTKGLAELLARAEKADTLVACTHGDVLGAMLEQLRSSGVPLPARPAIPKGGAWELEVADGKVRRAHLRPPPELGAAG